MIDPIAVDALLLRTQLPELVLRPGATLVARVAARGEQTGVIVLAGLPLTAQLPEDVAAGDTLRLKVTEVTAERITMRMEPPTSVDVGQAAPPSQPQAAQIAVSDPPRRSRTGGEESAGVTLSFESAALGRLDLRIDLRASGVDVVVATPPGPALPLAREAAGQLGSTLEQHVGRPASITVGQRREPLDFYA